MGLFDELHIPVNPDYSFDGETDQQLEYVNPVTLKNHLITLSNAYSMVTQRIVNTNTEIAALRRKHSEAKFALADFESIILQNHPPNTVQAKTIKTLAAYLRGKAHELALDDQHQALQAKLIVIQDDLKDREIRLQSARAVLDNIDLQGRHIQTHLSFLKHEYQHTQSHA